MIRTTMAALALSAILATTALAGDCYSCNAGPSGPRIFGGTGVGYGYSHGPQAGSAWNGYCDGGNCGGGCGGGSCCNTCNKGCCFPILRHTLHKIGCVVDFLIPDPCCHRNRGCGYQSPAVGCCQPSCGTDGYSGGYGGGYGPAGPAMMNDPFADDQGSPAMPSMAPPASAAPMKDARYRAPVARTMARPTATPAKPTAKPAPYKTAAVEKSSKPSVNGKSTGKSVLKVGYEDAIDSEDCDAPPAAPVSIRQLAREVEPARLTAKPVIRALKPEVRDDSMNMNPLR